MRESLVFFRPLEQKKYLHNFEALLSTGDLRLKNQRRVQYLAQVNDKIKSELANAAAGLGRDETYLSGIGRYRVCDS